MEIASWITLWKTVFIVTITAYALVAIWVTVQGAIDIKSMLATLRKRHGEKTE